MNYATKIESDSSCRIVHITTVPITLNFLAGQIRYLKEKGFEVCAISSGGKRLIEFGDREKIATYAVEMERRITPLKDLQTIYQIRKVLRKLRPQLVDAHTPKGGLIGMIGAWLARVPVRVYHMHGLPMLTATGYKYWALYLTEKVSCLLADRIICVSDSLRHVAIDKKLCSPEKIITLHHGSISGVDANLRFNPEQIIAQERLAIRTQYNIPSDAMVIGFVGRVVPDKGIYDLIKAWQILREEYSQLHLLIVGGRESHTPLKSYVDRIIQEDERIHLTGHVENVPPLYSIMDIFVFPSYREGFGLSVIEANAMGKPVVVNRIPGCINAVIDGVTGTLVPAYDVQALTETIQKYLEQPELRYKHGKAGRERVLRDFQPEDLWEASYREYMHLLHKKDVVTSGSDLV